MARFRAQAKILAIDSGFVHCIQTPHVNGYGPQVDGWLLCADSFLGPSVDSYKDSGPRVGRPLWGTTRHLTRSSRDSLRFSLGYPRLFRLLLIADFTALTTSNPNLQWNVLQSNTFRKSGPFRQWNVYYNKMETSETGIVSKILWLDEAKTTSYATVKLTVTRSGNHGKPLHV